MNKPHPRVTHPSHTPSKSLPPPQHPRWQHTTHLNARDMARRIAGYRYNPLPPPTSNHSRRRDTGREGFKTGGLPQHSRQRRALTYKRSEYQEFHLTNVSTCPFSTHSRSKPDRQVTAQGPEPRLAKERLPPKPRIPIPITAPSFPTARMAPTGSFPR